MRYRITQRMEAERANSLTHYKAGQCSRCGESVMERRDVAADEPLICIDCYKELRWGDENGTTPKKRRKK